MKAARGAKHLIFKTCIAAGFALGIILLWQTISTYEYVSGNMLMQAAQRDAEQKRAALQRTLRTSASPQTTSVTEAIIDSLDEWREQVAWIRVLNSDGKSIASAGRAPEEFTPPLSQE